MSLIEALPKDKRSKGMQALNLDIENSLVEHTLGLRWHIKQDKLVIRNTQKEVILTKRGMLSLLSSLYDPYGIINPIVVIGKLIFQSECKLGNGWDDHISQSNAERWKTWTNSLSLLEGFGIARCYKPISIVVTHYEIHHFCDASQSCYGAVSYLRMKLSNGFYHCGILMAKSRLAPVKGTTIPKLELSGATVAVHMHIILINELCLPISKYFFWTDSMIVLASIHNKQKRFKVFVANRLSMIHNYTDVNQWKFIQSADNPADDLSRGMTASELTSSERWLRGPKFLWQPDEMWETPASIESESHNTPGEWEVTKANAFLTKDSAKGPSNRFIEHFSDWNRLVKSLTWIHKFMKWRRGGKREKEREIQTDEYLIAEKAVIRYVQKQNIEDYSGIVKNELKKSSSLYRLEPFLDEDGLIRTGGRLGNVEVGVDFKHPYLLPRDNHVCSLILKDAHARCLHSGREHTMMESRRKFWIPKVRPMINSIIRDCVHCTRYKGNPSHQRMADLPHDRVTAGKPAFTTVGMDCFGPFTVKRGRKTDKRYGCIFTCTTTRAVHIEKLERMDADSFINALVRFMARRGCPELLRSDNGTNFRGALRELTKNMKEIQATNQVKSFLVLKTVKWVFNPPYASHMGGVWERLIRSVRTIMSSLVHKQALDDERLDTIFCEVESVLNNRPLTPISDDTEDLEALTPNHLVLLRPGPRGMITSSTNEDGYRKRWKHAQYVADCFWKRWIRSYLPSLQFRSKWISDGKSIKVGDVVLINDLNVLRQDWPLGRVVEVIPGRDERVRSVRLKTSTNTMIRPLSKLCLLEGVAPK